MFTGSNASVIRRMRDADEMAMETAARINRELHDQAPADRIALLPPRKPAQSVPSLPLLVRCGLGPE
jgi:hypothetical protein